MVPTLRQDGFIKKNKKGTYLIPHRLYEMMHEIKLTINHQ